MKFFRKYILGAHSSAVLPSTGDQEENIVEKAVETPNNPVDLETAEVIRKKRSPFFIGDDFTASGLQTATEYYNQKYPERGAINLLLMPDGYSVDELALKIKELRKNNPEGNPIKVIITSSNRVSSDEEDIQYPYHSQPAIITRDKIISMRDEYYENTPTISKILANKLGLELVECKPEDKEDRKYYPPSFQADYRSCHFIALGILKDLTLEDLEIVSTFESGYKPLAKSLKYSQSGRFIDEMLNEETARVAVKKDGSNVKEYFRKHTIKDESKEKNVTRIGNKASKFREALLSLPYDDENPPSTKVAARELLDKIRAENYLKDSGGSLKK